MQGDNYSDLTRIAGDSYFPPVMHPCVRARRQTCVSVAQCTVHVHVGIYPNSFPPRRHFYQLVTTESSDLEN